MERSGSVVFGIILVILFLVIMLGPILRRLFVPMIHRWIMGKMEDKVRRMAGMPTRKEERMARKQARRRENGGAARFRKAAEKSRARNRQRQPHSTIGLLNSLAEDVEFTEIREYSQYVESHNDSIAKWEAYPEEYEKYMESLEAYTAVAESNAAWLASDAVRIPRMEALSKMILEEEALEGMFEGQRFYDLMRYQMQDGKLRGANATITMPQHILDKYGDTQREGMIGRPWYLKLPAR